jgi:hypothetical protein
MPVDSSSHQGKFNQRKTLVKYAPLLSVWFFCYAPGVDHFLNTIRVSLLMF